MTAGPEQPFNIDTALGALSNNQLRALIDRADARQAERGTAIRLEIPLQPAEKQDRLQAREEFQNTLANFKDLIDKNNLVRPTLRDLAPFLYATKGQSWEALPAERQLAYPDFVWGNAAGRIERGRVYPGDPMVKELFDLLHEGEAEAIKAIIGGKLDEAGDQPWASAWREYLSPPAADGAEIADQPPDAGADAGSAPVERESEFARLVRKVGRELEVTGPIGYWKDYPGSRAEADIPTGEEFTPRQPEGIEQEESNRVKTLIAELRQASRRKPDETYLEIEKREEQKDQLQLQLSQALGLSQDDSYLSLEERREERRRLESLYFIGNDQQLEDLVSDPQQTELARRLFAQSPVDLKGDFEEFVTDRNVLLMLQRSLQQLGRKTYITDLRQAEEAKGREYIKSLDRFTRWEKFGELCRQEQESLSSDDEFVKAFIESNQANRDEMQIKEIDFKGIHQFMADLAQKAGVEIVSKGDWRFELKEIEPAANKAIPPEIVGDPELTRIYTGILQEENGAEMGEKFLKAVRFMMSNVPGLDFKTAALRLIKREFRESNG